jgi:hypothetical protein
MDNGATGFSFVEFFTCAHGLRAAHVPHGRQGAARDVSGRRIAASASLRATGMEWM